MRITASISKDLINRLIYGQTIGEIPKDEKTIDLRVEKLKQLSEPTPKLKYLPVGDRESRYQMLLMLLLHFHSDGYGFVLNLPKRELSEKLGCTLRTLNNSLEKLKEKGYITLGYKEHGIIKLLINGYEDSFKKEGKGYYILSQATLDELIAQPRLNTLRLLLKGMMDYDATSLSGKAAKMDKEKITRTVPAESHPKAVASLISNIGPAFSFEKDKSDTLVFRLNEAFMGRTVVREIRSNIGKVLHGRFSALSEKVKMDFIQLALQYGTDKVIETLDYLDPAFVKKNKDIGGYARVMIERGISETA